MRILVINAGSSSLKYKMFEAESLRELKGNTFADIKSHDEAIKLMLREIGDLRDLEVVGHRYVHGGRKFFDPLVIDEKNINELEELNDLAPLHNPSNLSGIRAIQGYLPDVKNAAVFDTAFYRWLPEKAKVYALPYEWYEEGIQRYGFHGTSHKYAARKAAEKMGGGLKDLKVISCHLGAGCSITAINKGVAVDTSMGLTPTEGLVMQTRPGDTDLGIVFVKLQEMLSDKASTELEVVERMIQIINKESGLKGLGGVSNYLDLLKQASLGDKRAKLAFDLFIYRIQKYIGAYFAILDGCDALVLTGAIGAGNPTTKKQIVKDMNILSETKVMAIPTDEEWMIASDIKDFLRL